MIDFSRGMGFNGHSNGGIAVQHLAGKADNVKKYNIKAAVCQHGGAPPYSDYGPTGSDVPFMFTSAAGGWTATGSSAGYNAAGNGDKVLWTVTGGGHFEPADVTIPQSADGHGGAGREDQPVGLFMACHIRGEHCDEVYGPSGDAICSNPNKAEMSECQTSKGPPPAPVRPVPASCAAELAKVCAGKQGPGNACSMCVMTNQKDLVGAGCSIKLGTHDDAWAWCNQTP